MSCTKHFLFFHWTSHSWRRNVSWSGDDIARETDMWGQPNPHGYVSCLTEYFCSECGASKSGAYCGCDSDRADRCKVRLAWIAAGSPTHEDAST